jgi:hypothetical protein
MALLIAGLLTIAGMLIPMLHRVLLPVQYLNTHLHELSHALVAQFTGAEVDEIRVNADGSGVTPVRGGNMLFIASAGYLGSSVFGALMIYFGRTEKTARLTLISLVALLCMSMVVWVRGDAVGEVSGIGWIVLLVGAALLLKRNGLVFFCQFLGLQQCLSSVQSMFELVKISSVMEVHSDATILQTDTGIPAIVWAMTWSVLSLVLVIWTLKVSWQPSKR